MIRSLFVALLLSCLSLAHAESGPFTGRWEIDLRSKPQRASSAECGVAVFDLHQDGDKITGDHRMSTVGCGRMNEGGQGAVKGVVINGVAALVVTSGRNGAVVLGTAALKGGYFHWTYREEIHPGTPENDSPLILDSAVLRAVQRRP